MKATLEINWMNWRFGFLIVNEVILGTHFVMLVMDFGPLIVTLDASQAKAK